MATAVATKAPTRPDRIVEEPLAPLPDVSGRSSDEASTTYSHYRTGLSRHRTGLSEHRTDLSEFRTDLSESRTEMSMRRTGMSFHRTRMSADRTLMSVIRTSLSLIGFGFTLYQVFEKLHLSGVMTPAAAPRNFGLTLITVGVLLLIDGIVNHARFGQELRDMRTEMRMAGLIHGETAFPVSITFLCAVLLLGVGCAAGASILFGFSVFG